ncbi:hypothetical protein [Rhodococcoides fascians]|uniref:hypothetical protein n=1 Tax=Rhodococcoides fascians TaxID=1828 RepID=UPI000B03C3E0|nr:hypothetical protein [Rhodococcus fascians]
MTITPTVRFAMNLTMIALTIIMTALSWALVFGAFDSDATKFVVGLTAATLLGFNLALLAVSFTERHASRRQHQHTARALSV